MGSKIGTTHIPISNKRMINKSITNIDMNPLAIFSLVRKVPTATTAMTVQRKSDNLTLDIDYLVGTPKQRSYNFIQNSDGKLGMTGWAAKGGCTVIVDEGIMTITATGNYTWFGVEYHPLIRNVSGQKVYVRSSLQYVAGNYPNFGERRFWGENGTTTSSYLTIPSDRDWHKGSNITTFIPAAADNEYLKSCSLEWEYGTLANVAGATIKLDMRVGTIDGVTYDNGAIGIDMGTSTINPDYNSTVSEMDAKYSTYLKPFGFDSGELDAVSIINFCKGTTGYVRSWRDLTGNGYHLTQTVVANMPIISLNDVAFSSVLMNKGDTVDQNSLTATGSILLGQRNFTITTKHLEITRGGNRYLIRQGTQMGLIANEGNVTFDVNGVQCYSSNHANDMIGMALSKNDTEQKLYVNGGQEYAVNTTPFTITDTGNTVIAHDGLSNNNNFYGSISELCFYGSVPPTRILGALANDAVVPNETITKTNYALDKVLGSRCAYALTKLHPDRVKCIRVRRQNDSQELDIGFIGKYIDSESLLNFAGYSTLEVLKWYDQSGNANDLLNNSVGYTNTTIGKTFTIPASVTYTANEPDKDGGNTAHRFATDTTAISEIKLPACIESNGTYSFEFWFKNTDGIPPINTIIAALINGDLNKRILTYIPSHSNWKYVKLENINVTDYSAINNYFSFRIGPTRDITICGLNVVKARSISNRPLIVEKGLLLSGVTFDGSSNGGGVTYGDHMTTSKTNCRARYIRDWGNGSNLDARTTWNQIFALKGTTNIALNKTVTASFSATLSYITDGNITGTWVDSTSGLQWVQVDLGSVQDIDNIIVWHYHSDERLYHNTKTEISEDGVNWTTVFDSALSGEYQEKHYGNIIFDKSLHNVDKFSVYTSFTANPTTSHDYMRIIGKGTPENQTSSPQNGWDINRYAGTMTGDFRIDTPTNVNMLARLSNVWDTGRAMLYKFNGDNGQLTATKDWKDQYDISGVSPVTASAGVATYPMNNYKLINPYPIVVGGSESQMNGSVKCLIEWDKVLTQADTDELKKCTL